MFWITLHLSLSWDQALMSRSHTSSAEAYSRKAIWHEWHQKPWWQKHYKYFLWMLYKWILISRFLVDIFFCWFKQTLTIHSNSSNKRLNVQFSFHHNAHPCTMQKDFYATGNLTSFPTLKENTIPGKLQLQPLWHNYWNSRQWKSQVVQIGSADSSRLRFG